MILSQFKYQSSLINQRRLFVECFPETSENSISTTDHYMWKFHSINSEINSYEFQCLIDDKIVGYYAAIKQKYIFKDNQFSVGLVCDVMTSKSVRGKGIFTKLGAYSTDALKKCGCDICIGFPIRREVIPGHLKVGWKTIFKLPVFIYVIRFDSLFKSKNIYYLSFLFNFLNTVHKKVSAFLSFQKNLGLSVKIYDSKDLTNIKNLDTFYCNWRQEVPISLNKNISFLKWRLSTPKEKYFIFVLENSENIVGVLIAKKFIKNNVPCMGILDLSILKEFHNKSNTLINELIKFSTCSKCEMIIVMISNYWAKKYKLFNFGFLNSFSYFTFISKNLTKRVKNSSIFDKSNWHLMWLNSDNL